MNYVEWLRVGRVLKWTVVVIAACIALVLYARFAFANLTSSNLGFIEIRGMTLARFEQVSTVTHVVLPDGTRRTVVDNPKQGVRISIDDRGYWGQTMTVVDHRPPADAMKHDFSFGDLTVKRVFVPGGAILTIDTSQPEHLGLYFAAATFAALIVATFLGAPFAREGDGHLEIALTKPVTRERLALGTMGADVVGMIAAFAMTVLLFFLGHVLFEAPRYAFDLNDAGVLAGGLAGAIAWYALLCAATASVRRTYGAILGLSWPVCGAILILADSDFGKAPIAMALHALAQPFSWIIPFSYMHFSGGVVIDNAPQVASMTTSFAQVPVLLALALVYGALAILQWRRVEA